MVVSTDFITIHHDPRHCQQNHYKCKSCQQDHLDNMASELEVVLLLRDERVVQVAEVEPLVCAHLRTSIFACGQIYAPEDNLD